MSSIIDDYSPIYHSIIDDIVSLKKMECDTNNDMDFDCDDLYDITENDISIRLNNDNYSNENITNYKNSIKTACDNFLENKRVNIEEDMDESKDDLFITEEINYYNSINNNYKLGESLLKTTQILLLTYIAYIYIIKFMVMVRNNNKNNVQNEGVNYTMFKSYILDGITMGSIIYILFEYIINSLESNNKLNHDKIKSLKNLINDNNEISTLINYIENISKYDSNTINASQLYIIIKNYKKLSELSLTNNKYTKREKIKDMNRFFNDIKMITLKDNNKFSNLTIDNQDKVSCLMKLIINKGNVEGTDCINDGVICNLSLNCGLYGLLQNQYRLYNDNDLDVEQTFDSQNFTNGLEQLNDDNIKQFYDYMQNNVLDGSIKYSIKNSNIYKVISNIFIIQIKYYNISKQDFVKYIYNYFSNYKNVNNITKLEIINNYKSLINMIYDDYIIWKNINDKKHYLVSNIVDNYKFTEIFNKHTSDDIKMLIDKLDETIVNIKSYRNIYKEDIISNIKVNEIDNNILYKLFLVVFICSMCQVVGYVLTGKLLISSKLNSNVVSSNNTEMLLSNLALVFVLIFLNSLIYSYWFKKSIDISYEKSTILDSNNKFLEKLYLMRKNLDNLYKIKNLDVNNINDLSLLFEELSIKYYTRNNDIIFSKFNSTNNYTVIDINDINNLLVDKLYYSTSDVLKIHECCSFLKEKDIKITIPHHEVVTNIIYILITVVVISYLLSDPNINPFDLFNRYLKNKQSGGSNTNITSSGLDQGARYVVYITLIYLSARFTKKLITSNVEYEKSLYS